MTCSSRGLPRRDISGLSPPPIRVARPPARITAATIIRLSPLVASGYQGGVREQEAPMFPLATVTGQARGETDRLLAQVVDRLTAEGWALAGVVQVNSGRPGRAHCDMDL